MSGSTEEIAGELMLATGRVIRSPEWRALDQIVAAARSAGHPIVVLGPAGVFEITVGTTESTEVTEHGTADERR